MHSRKNFCNKIAVFAIVFAVWAIALSFETSYLFHCLPTGQLIGSEYSVTVYRSAFIVSSKATVPQLAAEIPRAARQTSVNANYLRVPLMSNYQQQTISMRCNVRE
jgi:hypothetical protein